MELDSKLYLHDSDKAALDALKAVPGFSQAVKAILKVLGEQQYQLINMSTNLKLGKDQLREYYDLLPPICEKLGIEVPDLYIKMDVNPNAYTYGDTKPFIVLTSGLFESFPDYLIPTVIAHECGHIACHHSLYRTVGRILLSAFSGFVAGLANIALYPLQLAFAYWMRCSELSADRAAIICDGSADKTIETCMRFAGCIKDVNAEPNVDAFLAQARQYKDMVADSSWNRALEILLFKDYDHPLNAVRALEAKEWESTDRFRTIKEYVESSTDGFDSKRPIHLDPQKLIGLQADDAMLILMGLGFTNTRMIRNLEPYGNEKTGTVVSIVIGGERKTKADYYLKGSPIEIVYYEPKTEEEIALEHPGEILVKENSRYFIGKDHSAVREELTKIGFANIKEKTLLMPKTSVLSKDGTVARIIIDGKAQFEKGTWFPEGSEVTLYYYMKE